MQSQDLKREQEELIALLVLTGNESFTEFYPERVAMDALVALLREPSPAVKQQPSRSLTLAELGRMSKVGPANPLPDPHRVEQRWRQIRELPVYSR